MAEVQSIGDKGFVKRALAGDGVKDALEVPVPDALKPGEAAKPVEAAAAAADATAKASADAAAAAAAAQAAAKPEPTPEQVQAAAKAAGAPARKPEPEPEQTGPKIDPFVKPTLGANGAFQIPVPQS
jgi:hypothetical protein